MLQLIVEQLDVTEPENYFLHVVGLSKLHSKIAPTSRHRTEVLRRGEKGTIKFKSDTFSFQFPKDEIQNVVQWDATVLLNSVKTHPGTTVQQVGRATFHCAMEGTSQVELQAPHYPFHPVGILFLRWKFTNESEGSQTVTNGIETSDFTPISKSVTLPDIRTLSDRNCMFVWRTTLTFLVIVQDTYFFVIRPHGVANLYIPSAPFFAVKTTKDVALNRPTKASTPSLSFPVR